jgi:MFS family permease
MSESPPSPAASDADAGRLDPSQKGRIFAVVAAVVFFSEIAALQYTMIGASIPEIAPSFPKVGADINWLMIIFGLVGAAATPIFGKLSDLYGKKKMMLVTGLAFAAGSLLCAVTSNWPLFLLGRALQAVAIAAPTVAYGLFRDLLPRKYIPTAMGVVATGLGLSSLIAPVLAGELVKHYSWRSNFWFLLIYCGVMTVILAIAVPESKLRARQRLDLGGALLLSTGVGLALIWLSKGPDWGWFGITSIGYLIAGLVLLAMFVMVERRAEQPIIDMRLLFSAKVANVLFVAFFLALIIGAQATAVNYMAQSKDAAFLSVAISQSTHGLIPPSAVSFNSTLTYALGFTLLGYAGHLAVFQGTSSMLSGAGGGWLTGRIGGRRPLIFAALMFTVGSGLYVFFHASWVQMALVGVVIGLGFGTYYAVAPNLLADASPPEQQGITAGMLGVMNSIGTSVGLAVLTAFQAANPLKVTIGNVTKVVPQMYAWDAYKLNFVFAAVAGALALCGALYLKSGRTPATGGAVSDAGARRQSDPVPSAAS